MHFPSICGTLCGHNRKVNRILIQNTMKTQSLVIGEKFMKDISNISPSAKRDMESYVVNSLKVKIIKNLDNILEFEGKRNLRRLFLSPVFTVNELTKRVKDIAPEMMTYYFRELILIFDEAESKYL